MTNNTNIRIVVLFNEEHSAPYFLNPGESLPNSWATNYTIKSIHEA